ncbi:MAG: hypothetical protein KatS3mg043_1094 [Rhodothermaceae bacterium]|nr:MAG: hypothetical protein KatS3mg043_1094 [Rhodothermaceae bacterium]
MPRPEPEQRFRLVADFEPTGDQPRAIAELTEGLRRGDRYQTLLGATGTGKSVGYDDPVFIVERRGDTWVPRVTAIGPLVDAHVEQQRREAAGETVVVEAPGCYTLAMDPATGQTGLFPCVRVHPPHGPRGHVPPPDGLWPLRDPHRRPQPVGAAGRRVAPHRNGGGAPDRLPAAARPASVPGGTPYPSRHAGRTAERAAVRACGRCRAVLRGRAGDGRHRAAHTSRRHSSPLQQAI